MTGWQIAIGNVAKKEKPKPAPAKTATCPGCGDLMPKLLSNRTKRLFCSRACAAKHRSKEKKSASR